MRGCMRTGWCGRGYGGTYAAPLASLPDGAMVEVDGAPWLMLGGELLAWTPGGYRERRGGA